MEIWKKHLEIALKFIGRFKHMPGFLGAVALGGIGREDADELSDIDLAIFFEDCEEKANEIWIEHEELGKVNIDYEIVSYRKAKARSWDMEARWAFAHSKILLDPTGKIAKLIAEKVPLKEEERKALAMEGAVQAVYYCLSVPEQWIARKCLECAHYSIFHGLEELLKAVYVINNKLIPPPKWRLKFIERLRWKPKSLALIWEALKLRNFSESELRRRMKACEKLCFEVLQKVEELTGMSYEEMEKIV